MENWSLVYDEFKPHEEGLREALTTLGNGNFCTRGAAEESSADDIHYPGTYVAGGYNRLSTEVKGHILENEDLVNMPNWLPLSFRIEDGDWLDLRKVNVTDYRLKLDFRRGLLIRKFRFTDDKGRRTHVKSRRLVHMRRPHLAALEMRVTPENWSGEIEFRTALDGRVINDGVARYRRLNRRHLEPIETMQFQDDGIYLRAQTTQSRLEISEAARTVVRVNDKRFDPPRRLMQEHGYIAQYFRLTVSEQDEVRVEKCVALYTSADPALSEPGCDSRGEVCRAGSFKELLKSHSLAWKYLWRLFRITFWDRNRKREMRIDKILHLHTFHLLQTTSINTMSMSLDVGVPPRGWHGEAYRGHIMWDELYIFPTFNLRLPEITKQVLMYRYRRLGEARAAAKRAGYRGAMFPWQSGSNGREESQKLHLNPRSGRWIADESNLQRHVNSAIAYNIYNYYQVTDDKEFLSFYGAEIIFEVARFWSSIANYNPDLDRYEISDVMGPDEYHVRYPGADKPGLKNNAYTNVMAVWVFQTALELLTVLPEDAEDRLREELEIDKAEIRRWQDLTRKMRIPFHGDGIISQFEGYDDLAEFDWDAYKEKYGSIQRLDRILEAENDSTDRYKLSKQADVLMLFYLFSADELREIFENLGYRFEYETIPKNIEYYLKRTSHGSTLSQVVHSWVLARSDRARSWKLYNQALRSDVSDVQGGTTPEGIHLGAMAGTIDQLHRGYTGIVTRRDVLWLNPCLPDELKELCLQIRYRGCFIDIKITDEKVEVARLRSEEPPISIGFKDQIVELASNERKSFSLK